jgi:hypothetical protein
MKQLRSKWVLNMQPAVVSGCNRFLTVSIYPLIFLLSPIYSTASPWLESDDPFIRADLQLLADAGAVSAPTSHYPLRWSLLGDELNHTHDKAELAKAGRHIEHALSNARYQRGNLRAKAFYADNVPLYQGYGQFTSEEWGGYTSYDHLEDDFAFRVSSGYSKYGGDEDFKWNDSYLALNAGSWLLTVGSLERWWGQGWQHNLIIGSSAQPTPELSISYMGDNTLLGNWSAEALIGLDDKPSYHNALRLVAKPAKVWELGVTYQTWADDMASNGDDSQLAVDSKLALPEVAGIYHAIYTELASSSNGSELGAWLAGWSGQFDIAEQTLRIVLEKQKQTNNESAAEWDKGQYPHYGDGAYRNTYLRDNSYSAAAYLQLENDHKLALIYQKADITTVSANKQATNSTQITYRLPALAGMVHLGASYSQTGDSNEKNLWTGYEFRF